MKLFQVLVASLSVLVSTAATASVNVDDIRKKLEEANRVIAMNEGGIKGLEITTQNITEKVRKECGVDLSSKKATSVTCSMDHYSSMIGQLSQIKTSQEKVGEQLADARQAYKKIMKDAKSQLTPADYHALLETSGDLSDTQIRRLKVNAKADALKSEVNQAKALIEQSEQYKLLNKAITNTLNSRLFCQARDRCDQKAGNIYDGDVASKIMSNAARSVARSKVNAKAPAATNK